MRPSRNPSSASSSISTAITAARPARAADAFRFSRLFSWGALRCRAASLRLSLNAFSLNFVSTSRWSRPQRAQVSKVSRLMRPHTQRQKFFCVCGYCTASSPAAARSRSSASPCKTGCSPISTRSPSSGFQTAPSSKVTEVKYISTWSAFRKSTSECTSLNPLRGFTSISSTVMFSVTSARVRPLYQRVVAE